MKYNEDNGCIELSVRSLCEMAHRCGDLGGMRVTDAEAMVNGAEIHRKLAREAGTYYHPEVSLSLTMEYEGTYYCVSGRADGVLRTPDGLLVDEIKCVRRFDFYEPPREVFLSQMKCYAYFLAVREELSDIRCRLTYYQVENGKIKYFPYHFTTKELREHFVSLLSKIRCRAEHTRARVVEALPTAASARFPYHDLRDGQEWMIRECFAAARRGRRLFIEAPTGTGKTISSLYPAVRALGEGHVDKIFYLTAKASTRREAYRAAADLFETGVRLRTVVVTAKEQCCMCGSRLAGMATGNLCNSRDCEYARGYYDRVEEAVTALLSGGNGYPRRRIEEVAKQYGVCPYELSLEVSEYCDIIICDYNYVFDPSVYFRRYFSSDVPTGKYVFLIDEAHNLPDRARQMYSAELRRSTLDALVDQLDENDSELVSILDSFRRAFEILYGLCRESLTAASDGQEMGYYAAKQPPIHFDQAVERASEQIDAWLKKHREHPLFDVIRSFAGALHRYLQVGEYFDRGFLSYAQVLEGDIAIKTCCLDPSPIMDTLLHRAHAAILFSATLTPFDYYGSLLGGCEKASHVSLPSPFDGDKLCVAVADYVSTRFEEREKNIGRFATLIAAAVTSRPGNYIAYFPSYACLEQVLSVFVRKYPKVKTVVQTPNMGIKEKEAFLSAFKEDEGHLRVGFCVLGGAFSEGVDLPGSRLIGTIVFGVGLPGLSDERNMIRDYADPDGADGYDYAYTYPGMNHVLQAAGRVIRRDEDSGIVILADDRYATPKYRALFPSHWKNIQYAGNARSLAEIVRRFWEKDGSCE